MLRMASFLQMMLLDQMAILLREVVTCNEAKSGKLYERIEIFSKVTLLNQNPVDSLVRKFYIDMDMLI